MIPNFRQGAHWTESYGPFTTLIREGTEPADENKRRPDDVLVGAYEKQTVEDALAAIKSDDMLGWWLSDSLDLVINSGSENRKWLVDETVEAIATMAPAF